MRRLITATAIACALAFALPAAASAAELHVEGTTIVYTGNPGVDHIRVGGDRSPAMFQMSDTGAATVAAPCTREDAEIFCPGEGLTGIRFDLGNGDDQMSYSPRDEGSISVLLPETINAGAGDDLVISGPLDDVIDGGAGKDDLIAIDGNDIVKGGDGDDKVRTGPGNDQGDGGAGDDFVNGGEGNDKVKGGTGKDELVGDEGDDELDFRNDEVDTGGARCDAGIDTVLLDPNDNVLEFKSGSNAYTTAPDCEKASGQAAPTPVNLFAGGTGKPGLKVTVDLVEAFPTTIVVEILAKKKLLARGTIRRRDTRSVVRLKLTATGKRFKKRHFFGATIRVTVKDAGGRRSVTNKSIVIGSL